VIETSERGGRRAAGPGGDGPARIQSGGLRGPAENFGRSRSPRCYSPLLQQARVRSASTAPHAVHKPILLLLRAERRAAVAAGAESTPTADVGR